MGLFQSTTEIDYPESDGKPMGETDIHRKWMIRIYDLLEQRYRGQRVYIGSDLLLYYEEGNPKRFVVPDVFVVKDSEPAMRRTYRLWDEGRAPDVVIEVTSRATRRTDERRKPETYAHIGVKELFLYDPTCDYLDPPLQGYALGPASPVRIEPDAQGFVISLELGITLHLQSHKLVIRDAATGDELLTEAETKQAALNAEHAARKAADLRASAAEAKAAALEDELRRLRDQLGQQDESAE